MLTSAGSRCQPDCPISAKKVFAGTNRNVFGCACGGLHCCLRRRRSQFLGFALSGLSRTAGTALGLVPLGLALLGEPDGLADAVAEVVQLRPAAFAAPADDDLGDER